MRNVVEAIAVLLIAAALSGALVGRAGAQDHAQGRAGPQERVPLYDNLGTHHFGISSAVPGVQDYMNQGMRLYYAFNHAEAIRAFEEAARLDEGCAICHWGIALAYGPNINAPMDSAAGVAAYEAVERAVERAGQAGESERALIEALAVRYAAVPPADRAGLDSAYAGALAEVVRRYPGDDEAAVLYAESLMNLSPWNYWTADQQPRPGTEQILSHLERVISANPEHPGACHFYIHAVEAAHPERAVACAERLASVMPGAGHLVHMPGHIYIRVGRYMDAIRANEHAVHADETYIRDQRPGLGIYTAGYYPHNYDFMAFAAAMAGRSEQSLQAARKVRDLIAADMLGAPGMTFLQQFMMRPVQVSVRFGRWDTILAEPEPAEDLLHARGLWHYGRGRAYAARSEVTAAESELSQLSAIVDDPGLEDVPLEFNFARTILQIAKNVLGGEIAAVRGDFDRAVELLNAATALEDGLTYGEPPEWLVPVRHDLGAILLSAGRAVDAEAAYRQDLRRFPDNGWSLHGLAVSLERQGRSEEAAQVRAQATRAWRDADVGLSGSRF